MFAAPSSLLLFSFSVVVHDILTMETTRARLLLSLLRSTSFRTRLSKSASDPSSVVASFPPLLSFPYLSSSVCSVFRVEHFIYPSSASPVQFSSRARGEHQSHLPGVLSVNSFGLRIVDDFLAFTVIARQRLSVAVSMGKDLWLIVGGVLLLKTMHLNENLLYSKQKIYSIFLIVCCFLQFLFCRILFCILYFTE